MTHALVAGRIGRHRVGAVGDDAVGAGGGDQRHIGHVVDRELAAVTAFGDALRKDARRGAVRHRQAVADEQDDVLRLAAFGRREGVPSYARLVGAGHRLDRVPAGRRETRAADPVGGLPEAVLVGDDLGRRAQHLAASSPSIVTLTSAAAGCAGKLDLQVEGRRRRGSARG